MESVQSHFQTKTSSMLWKSSNCFVFGLKLSEVLGMLVFAKMDRFPVQTKSKRPFGEDKRPLSGGRTFLVVEQNLRSCCICWLFKAERFKHSDVLSRSWKFGRIPGVEAKLGSATSCEHTLESSSLLPWGLASGAQFSSFQDEMMRIAQTSS